MHHEFKEINKCQNRFCMTTAWQIQLSGQPFLLYQMFASTSRRSTCICSIWNGLYSPLFLRESLFNMTESAKGSEVFFTSLDFSFRQSGKKQNPTTKFRAHHSVLHTSRAMITRVHASGKQRNLSSLSLIAPCALRIHILVGERISAVWENQNEATFFFRFAN